MKSRVPYNQSRRLFAVLRMLCTAQAPMNLEDIKEELPTYGVERDDPGISDRNLQRDIRFLREELGYDITGGATRGYLLHAQSDVLPIYFSREEIEALLLGRRLFLPFDNTHWGEAIESLYEKIRTLYHKNSRPNERFDSADLAFIMNPVARRDWNDTKKETLKTIYHAAQTHHEVKITYTLAEHPEGVPIHLWPHKLIIHRDSIYCLAIPSRSKQSKKLKLYLMDRIIDAQQTRETFTPQSTEKFERQLENAFGIMIKGRFSTVRIVFHNEVARYIRERIWHPSQTIEEVHDGICLSMGVYVNEELASWICGFGDNVIRVEPTSLARMVQNFGQSGFSATGSV